MNFFIFLISSLTCFRLTRLITNDKITEWLRSAVIRNAPTKVKKKAKEGISCPFCVSFYWAAIIAWYLALFNLIPWFMYLLWMPSIWGMSVMINQLFVYLSDE